MYVELGEINQNCDVGFLRLYWLQQIWLHQLSTAVAVARSTNCTAGSCMKYFEARQRAILGNSKGVPKTALGSAFNQTTHVTMVNTSD